MNYLCAKQRVEDQRWDYTRNGRACGYCHEFLPFTECSWCTAEQAEELNAKELPFLSKYHTDGHTAAEEACACYKEYLLDHELRLKTQESENAKAQYRCQKCGVWTTCVSTVGAYRLFTLCPEHATRDNVADLFSVSESWES